MRTQCLEDNLMNMSYALIIDGFYVKNISINVIDTNTKKNYIVKMNEDKKIIFIWTKGGETDETDKAIEVRK